MKRSTLVANDSYGWWTKTSLRRDLGEELGVAPAPCSRACVIGRHGSSFSSGRSSTAICITSERSSRPGIG